MTSSPARLPADLVPLLCRLQARRAALPGEGTTLYRAAHLSETGGLFTLERAAEVGILSLYVDLSPAEEAALAAACGEALGLAGVYLKRRPPEARHVANVAREQLSPPGPVWGEARPELLAHEGGVPFLIRPGADLSTGLFSDARPARAWLREHAAGRRVLNTFAYTCGFGLMAQLGGAAEVKNLDASRKVLRWGQENYARSGLEAPDFDFIAGDVFDWLSRFARRGERFGAVVLDPPSFARGQQGVWRAERDYPALVRQAAAVLEPGGLLLALLNHAGVEARRFQALVTGALDGRGRPLAHLGAGEDYPGADHLKGLALQLD